MQLFEHRPVDLFDRSGRPFGGATKRVIGPVQQRHHPFHGGDRRIVVVLLNRRQHLPPPGLDLRLRKRRVPDDIGQQTKDRFEVLDQAVTADIQGMSGHRDPQRHAPRIEVF